MRRLAIGIGCRRGCATHTIAALVREALGRLAPAIAGWVPLIRPVGPLLPRAGEGENPGGSGAMRLYTVADKGGEAGLRAAASELGLDLVILPRAALEAVMDRVATRSPAAEAALGLASVSEAAALAGAGPGGRLVLPRIAAGGATCAIAEAPP